MTLEEKIEHVRRYGLSEGSVLNPDEESILLQTHIQYLQDRNEMLLMALEDIASGYAPENKVKEYAEYILGLYNTRDWKATKF